MNENGLIYGLEERPPLKDTLFAAIISNMVIRIKEE